MDNNASRTTNVWPYVVAGCAIGGGLGYLFMTEEGRKIGRTIADPHKLADNIERGRDFSESNARKVTDQIHDLMDRAKNGVAAAEQGYREAGEEFQSSVLQRIEDKKSEIVSGIHETVDNVSRTALTVEHSVLDPLLDVGAMVKGLERGIEAATKDGTSESKPDQFAGGTTYKFPNQKTGTGF